MKSSNICTGSIAVKHDLKFAMHVLETKELTTLAASSHHEQQQQQQQTVPQIAIQNYLRKESTSVLEISTNCAGARTYMEEC
jgi:hypothetical protein